MPVSKASPMPTSKKTPARKTPARKAPAKRKPAAKGRRAGSRAARGRSKAPERLSELQLDLIGVALAVLGAFLGAVVWGGWNGGPVGSSLAQGSRILIGSLVVLLPVALVAGGVLVVARESIPGGLAVKTGAVLLLCSGALALTLGTFGLAAGAPASGWHLGAVEQRGGILGQAIAAGVTPLVGLLGGHLLAIFLFTAGAVLISGVSLASLAQSVGNGAVDATRTFGGAAGRVKRPKRSLASGKRPAKSKVAPEPVIPPEPEPEELIVRATHVEAGAPPEYLDLPSGLDDLDAVDDPLTVPPEPTALPLSDADEPHDEEADGPAELTPMGRYRDSVVDDPGFKWKRPPKRLLTRSTKEQNRRDPAEQRETAQRLVESLGHHGVNATLVGTVSGPHITRYELQLAPGIKMSKVANLRDDLAYALASTEIRILAPDSGKAGGRRRGTQRESPDRHPRRRLAGPAEGLDRR